MIRILHIVSVMNPGGLETFIMNVYRNINRDEIQFDFLVTRKEDGYYDGEILEMGGRLFQINHISKVGYFGYKRELKFFFASHKKYQIIHSHMNSWSGLLLSIAKKNNVYSRIAHSHSVKNSKKAKYGVLGYIFKELMSRKINNVSTIRFACSTEAGKWLYKGRAEFTVLVNGVDTKKFMYSKKNLDILKEKCVCDTDFIIGHVGSFREAKNHLFIIDVFKEIRKINNESSLLFIGDGEMKTLIEMKCIELGIENSVKFLGLRSDTESILKTMDVFLFPSLYEGFGISLLEAQISGLKCFTSDVVPKSVDIGCDLIEFLSLNMSPKEWANIITTNSSFSKTQVTEEKVKEYDIFNTAMYLSELYIKLNQEII